MGYSAGCVAITLRLESGSFSKRPLSAPGRDECAIVPVQAPLGRENITSPLITGLDTIAGTGAPLSY